MSRHDPLLRVRHMRDYAREAVELLGAKSVDDVVGDRVLELALTRLVQIIGEAAARMAPQVRSQHPGVAWRDAAAMRNKLVHDYDYVDVSVVYETVRNDLPPLLAQLEDMLK
jgi:uncharacterized protein with HEPN domain